MLRALFLTIIFSACVNATIDSFGSTDQLSMEHLKEHYGNKIDIEKHNSPSDRQFYYFQVGDTNKDHFLDGVELFKMITEHQYKEAAPKPSDVEMVEVQVDQVLSDFDQDLDGLISFSEYSRKFD